MATQVCEDCARVNGEGANSACFAAAIKFHSKQHIRGFRLAVGLPSVIRAMLKIRILKILRWRRLDLLRRLNISCTWQNLTMRHSEGWFRWPSSRRILTERQSFKLSVR